MKVLHVMPYSPVPPRFGGALRVYHMIKALARRHEVTIATYGSPEDRMNIHEHFDVPLDDIHVIPPSWLQRHRRFSQGYALCTRQSHFYHIINTDAMTATVRQLLNGNAFDAVQTEFPLEAAGLCNSNAVKILDAHNIEYEIFQRMGANARSPMRRRYYNSEYKKLYRDELNIINRQDALFVMSERDRAVFDRHAPHIPKFVVPNGVDASYFQPSPEAPEPYSLVFTGMMGYVPNSEGMLYFLDHILPIVQRDIQEVKIYIVGQRPPKELMKHASERVVITGFVDDVRPYVDRASVYVVPLRSGSGTRLKIMEAMAMKKPIVTTSIGCEGIDVKHGKSALIADEPQAFAQAVVELLRDAELRRQLIHAGYELVRTRYEWSIIGDEMYSAYQTLVPSGKKQEAMVV